MSFDLERIYNLLPAIHRIRDAEQGEPLRALLSVIADQVAVLEEDLAQLYDDQFVETAAAWVLPYIGDLVGVRGLQGTGSGTLSPRAEVANTIAYRRRKGTAAMLEQLARDLTGLPARAVEFFELLVATQYMNHLRPRNRSVITVRNANRLEFLGTPFERRAGLENAMRDIVWKQNAGTPEEQILKLDWTEYPGTPIARRKRHDDLPHTVDVRRIARGRGRYNIPNVGIFLWRLRAYSLTLSPAVPVVSGGTDRFFFSPLGCNMQLFNLPVTEDDVTHLAEPLNVPIEITRRMMKASLADFYGAGSTFMITTGAVPVDRDKICVCDLRDDGPSWANMPSGDKVAVDPVLGRVAFGSAPALPVQVSFHYGFSANMGGGEYDRTASSSSSLAPEIIWNPPPGQPPPSFTPVIAALNAGELLTITNSGRYFSSDALTIDAQGKHLELRAGNKHRPTIELAKTLEITGDENGEVTLDGLLITGGALKVVLSRATGLKRLRLRHCTLVPGIALETDGTPKHPDTPSLIVNSANTVVEIEHCILGGLRISRDATVRITNSIIDATSETGIAYAGLAPARRAGAFGGELTIRNSTVIGRVYADLLELASNTIFLASLAGLPPRELRIWKGPVQARRRQEGCVRFSFLPAGSRTPRRYYCQPKEEADESRVRPIHSSLRYADARYCQLSVRCPAEIQRGADDESEMGAFHDLFLPQRESHLRARLDEYLRFGLEAGIFYTT